jgi:hypothetical protein
MFIPTQVPIPKMNAAIKASVPNPFATEQAFSSLSLHVQCLWWTGSIWPLLTTPEARTFGPLETAVACC